MAKKNKSVDELREDREALALQIEIQQLQRSLMPEGLLEQWGDLVDRQDRFETPNNFGLETRTSVGYDRKDGDNTPFWVSEQEHSEQRGIARYLAQVDETVIGAIGTMSDYVLGSSGGTVTVSPKIKGGDQTLATRAEQIWQMWVDEHRFDGDLERELFARRCIDGERAIWLPRRSESLVPGLVIVEPEWITEPDPRSADILEDHYHLPSCNWKYGIARSDDWQERFVGVFAQRYGEQGDWEFIPGRDLVWDVANVVRRVKRGGSDLFAIYRVLESVAKLTTNTVLGAQIQACIAYIREHAPGTTRDGITAAAGSDYSFTRKTPAGNSVTQKAKRMLPGTVLDVNNGLRYHAGPVGAGAGVGFLDIAQGALRRVGVRWGMPEYMVSGDASNANYSSTLVAGTPFVRRMQTRQYCEAERRRELATKVLSHACERGAFSRWGLNDPRELLLALSIDVSFPDIAGADQAAEVARDQGDLQNRVVSRQTIAEKRGYDWEQEQQRMAEEPEQRPVIDPLAIQESVRIAARDSWRNYP